MKHIYNNLTLVSTVFLSQSFCKYFIFQIISYLHKSKEIEVLGPIFPDYVISCDYVLFEHEQ